MMGIYPFTTSLAGQKAIDRDAILKLMQPEKPLSVSMNLTPKRLFDLAIKFDEQPGEQVLSNMPEKKC